MPARVMRSPVRREWCISGRLLVHFSLKIRDIEKNIRYIFHIVYVRIVDIVHIY